MNKRWLIGALVSAAVVQLAVPVTMILQRETILRNGRAYKFRTQPVDPYDAFRGRYVQLAFDQNHVPRRSHDEVQPGREWFARVAEGPDGFAVIPEVTAARPAQGDYLAVTETWRGGRGTNAGSVYFTLPFDRYYLEETKAPRAEQIYRDHSQRNPTNGNTYAVVRIKAGDAVLADLYVADKPIRDYFTNRNP